MVSQQLVERTMNVAHNVNDFISTASRQNLFKHTVISKFTRPPSPGEWDK